MDSLEAQSKGLPWTDFKDIPQLFRHLYDITLACTPIARDVVRALDAYEMCCEYWFNNQLLKSMGLIESDIPERMDSGKEDKSDEHATI